MTNEELLDEVTALKNDLSNTETELEAVTDERDDLLSKLRTLESALEDLWRSI